MMDITKRTVVKLDPHASETPLCFRESGVYGRVDAITPYAVNDQEYNSYTLQPIIEEEQGGYKVRAGGTAYFVPAHLIIEILGQWDPSKREIIS